LKRQEKHHKDNIDGLDRIDNTKGYVIDNVVPCCGHCNLMKRGMTVLEFKEHIQRIVKQLGWEY